MVATFALALNRVNIVAVNAILALHVVKRGRRTVGRTPFGLAVPSLLRRNDPSFEVAGRQNSNPRTKKVVPLCFENSIPRINICRKYIRFRVQLWAKIEIRRRDNWTFSLLPRVYIGLLLSRLASRHGYARLSKLATVVVRRLTSPDLDSRSEAFFSS